MVSSIRIPKPGYLRSKFVRSEVPDAALYQTVEDLVETFQLGQIQTCYRAPQSNSLNFILTTDQGKFVFRKHSLSEDTVAHEYEVLSFLEKRNFPAPQMRLTKDGKAWVTIEGDLYSMYTFVDGFCPANFIWTPSGRKDVIQLAGEALGNFHKAVDGLTPSSYKWDAYQPNENKRWRDGAVYREAFVDIRALLAQSGVSTPVDDFARTHIDAIEQMLNAEARVEGCSELSKVVIHGDYAPWNILFQRGRRLPFILDFNSARLDLKIFDVILGTFFFAWHQGHLDPSRALAFQQGYIKANALNAAEIELASDVFQWVMGRSMAERLRTHYLDKRFLIKKTSGLERFYNMCLAMQQHPQRFLIGLKPTS
ncbi:MAG: phosphotransferase [Chloroflexota bacterium]